MKSFSKKKKICRSESTLNCRFQTIQFNPIVGVFIVEENIAANRYADTNLSKLEQ